MRLNGRLSEKDNIYVISLVPNYKEYQIIIIYMYRTNIRYFHFYLF